MAIDIHRVYTAKQLREAIGLARAIIDIVISQYSEKPGFGFKYKETALKERLKEAEELNIRDALEYIYRDITRRAWLAREIDRFDEREFTNRVAKALEDIKVREK